MKFRSLRILQLLKVLFTGLSFQTNTTYAFASDKEILQKHKKKKTESGMFLTQNTHDVKI